MSAIKQVKVDEVSLNSRINRLGSHTAITMSSENDNLLFRLRTGHATFKNINTNEIYVSETMVGFDGECSLRDAINFCKQHGVEILVP